jgi:hypothetical protein
MTDNDRKLIDSMNELINDKVYDIYFLLGYLSAYVTLVRITGSVYDDIKNHIVYYDGKHEIDL